MTKTYKMVEDAFWARTDALCEDTLPSNCNCNNCPCRLLCEILCAVDSSEEVPPAWLEQLRPYLTMAG